MNQKRNQAKPDDLGDGDLEARCHDCGTVLSGRYCPNCGQKHQRLKQPAHLFVRDALVELFGVDGRLWPSLRLLFTRPGELTAAYIEGQRSRYLRPLRLYLSATLLFFFLLSLIDPASRLQSQLTGITEPDSTSLASIRLELIEKRIRDDSTRLAGRLDAVDSIVSNPDSTTTPEELERARARLQATRRDVEIRRKRFLWQQDILASYPPDSLIRPKDLADASVLVFPGADGMDDEFEVTTGLPDWAIRNVALRRMRSAKTNEEQLTAGADFLRSMIGRLPAVMFLLLPVFALLLKPLYSSHRIRWLTTPFRSTVARIRGVPSKGRPPTKHYYTDHLVFGLHTHAFAFFVFSVLTILSAFAPESLTTKAIVATLSCSLPIYFLLAQRKVYQEGWVRTIAKASLLAAAYSALLLGLGFTFAFVLTAVIG